LVSHITANVGEAEQKALSIIEQMLGNAPIAIKHAKKSINWGI
jgi:hypothetical protein